MRIVFAGTPGIAAVALRELVNSGIEISLVITREDAPIGRKQQLAESPVAAVARELGLHTLKTNTISQENQAEILKSKADLGVVIAFGSFLSDAALELLPLGWINLHFSLLPKYRGAAPVQHAILNGESTTGVTIFQIDSAMDSGPIYCQVPTLIEKGESAGRLLERLTFIGISALLETLPQLKAGIAKPIPQDEAGVSFAPKILRSQARIDWSSSAHSIENFVCAFNPEPSAWTKFHDSDIKILECFAVDHKDPVIDQIKSDNQSAGQIPASVYQINDKVFVSCGDANFLEVRRLQPSGKQAMNALDWFRGLRDKGNLVLE